MTVEELELRNRDGKRMPATIFHPDTPPIGTAVVLHGLGAWRNQPILASIAELLARRGYCVLRFDDANGVISPDGDFFTSTTTGYTRDVEDALAYAREAAWCTGSFLLVGHSLGGLVAGWYAQKHPEDISRLILIAPAISWKTMWWRWLPISLLWYIQGYRKVLGVDGKRFLLSPLWWRDFFKFDLAAYAPRIPVPTLVISAEQDHTVAHVTSQRSLARKFPKGEHTMVSWTNHIFAEHEDEVIDTIDQWLTSS